MKADTASSAPIRRPMHKIVAIFRRFIIRSFGSDAQKPYTDAKSCTDKCVSRERRNVPVWKEEVSACPIDAMLSVVDGRWKGTILWRLSNGPLRTSELRRSIPEITERMLWALLPQGARKLAQDLLGRSAIRPPARRGDAKLRDAHQSGFFGLYQPKVLRTYSRLSFQSSARGFLDTK